MENLLLGLTIFNILLTLAIALKLRHYLFPKGIEVYFNGQRHREGIDYVMKDGVPEFDFPLKDRGNGTGDVITIRRVPRVPTTEMQAKQYMEMVEDEDGEEVEIPRVKLVKRWEGMAG